jgi:putative membrane protein
MTRSKQSTKARPEDGSDPDARFTFANERTFLAWHRTALALVVAGLAIIQLLPPFPGAPWGRHLLAVPLIALGAVVSVTSYFEWNRDQQALRRDDPLPPSRLPRILAAAITAISLLAAALVLFAPAKG